MLKIWILCLGWISPYHGYVLKQYQNKEYEYIEKVVYIYFGLVPGFYGYVQRRLNPP